jgi:hypothetical protein
MPEEFAWLPIFVFATEQFTFVFWEQRFRSKLAKSKTGAFL